MSLENYHSLKKTTAKGDTDEEQLDPWTKRLDLLLKAIIALATILGPVYVQYVVSNAKKEIKTEQVAAKEAINANATKVKNTLDKHNARVDKKLGEVEETATYTKAITAEWWAERTGDAKVAAQAEQAKSKLEALEPSTALPPPISPSP